MIRACTPGPISDIELIIVHYGLYSLFTQLSICTNDETLMQDYNVQSETCRETLETILSNLSFYMHTNTDSIRALYMAVGLPLPEEYVSTVLISDLRHTVSSFPTPGNSAHGLDVYFTSITYVLGFRIA